VADWRPSPLATTGVAPFRVITHKAYVTFRLLDAFSA
jgi:hypothetical protein